MPVIVAFGKLKQEDYYKFDAILDFIARFLENKKTNLSHSPFLEWAYIPGVEQLPRAQDHSTTSIPQ